MKGAIDLFALYFLESLHIEDLVIITAALMVVGYILDVFRRRSSSQFLLFFFHMLLTLPSALLHYILGLMQLTKSNNDVYQVWAVVLVTLQYNIKAVRPSGIFVKQNPVKDIMSSLWTANILGTRTTMLKFPLWLLWALNSFRIILGFADMELTSSRHRKHLRLLTEYMRTEHINPPLKDCDAKAMKGYKYVVQGEDEQEVKTHPPEYRVHLEVTKEKKFITTDKVWEGEGRLLGIKNESNEHKDLCLAFALFKLLRRRFFGLPIHEANKQKTKDFVLKGLFDRGNSTDQPDSNELALKGLVKNHNPDRTFHIIEAELAFLNDFFFTRFPVMFARGFPTLRLVLSLSVIGVACYLALLFYHLSAHLESDLSKTTNGVAVTCILLSILAMKEIWEMVSYILSDWTKVLLISNYVQNPWWKSCRAIVGAVRILCTHKIGKRWHGILWQYNLLQSFQYLPWLNTSLCTRCRHALFKRRPGYKGSPSTRLPKEVKNVICESLQKICNQPEAMENYLSAEASLIYQNSESKIPQKMATETQKILVWHIATCYCEIKLAETSHSARSLTSPFMLENIDSPEEGLESHYKVATALSQYCAYLLTRGSPLVPDRSLAATGLFRSTVRMTNQSLRRCRSWEDVLKVLNELADKTDDDNDVGIGGNDHDKDDKNGENKKRTTRCSIFRSREERKRRIRSRAREGMIILKMGLNHGKDLINSIKTNTERWKFLEEFWAGYLLYLASAVSPASHKQSLSNKGGEFLTHVWALLFHAGVLRKPTRINHH